MPLGKAEVFPVRLVETTMSRQPNDHLARENQVFEKHRGRLAHEYSDDHWVLIRESEIVMVSPDFQEVARCAIERFGVGPYMITQVKPRPVVLPSAMMLYHQAVAAQNG